MFKSPELVLRARSVAIVGASERARWPSNIFGNLRANGFAGPVYPINPKYSEVGNPLPTERTDSGGIPKPWPLPKPP